MSLTERTKFLFRDLYELLMFTDVKAPLSDLYGVPVPRAMKLVRCLAQAGRNLAATLVRH